ncbi:MAG: F0F1 ATP synthase subunit B [Fluviibacter sp.]|nr:F0F1 ATP synthase subunit B [Rhodocyclales bacterium]
MNLNATLFAQLIVFFILVWFTMKFVWPPITKALDDRAKKIADGLAAAERGKHELELASKRSAEVVREGKEKSADVLANAEKRAVQIIEDAKAQAKVEADRIVAAARGEVEQEVVRAREQLRDQVAALAVAGAEKILRKEINAGAHADILVAIKQGL